MNELIFSPYLVLFFISYFTSSFSNFINFTLFKNNILISNIIFFAWPIYYIISEIKINTYYVLMISPIIIAFLVGIFNDIYSIFKKEELSFLILLSLNLVGFLILKIILMNTDFIVNLFEFWEILIFVPILLLSRFTFKINKGFMIFFCSNLFAFIISFYYRDNINNVNFSILSVLFGSVLSSIVMNLNPIISSCIFFFSVSYTVFISIINDNYIYIGFLFAWPTIEFLVYVFKYLKNKIYKIEENTNIIEFSNARFFIIQFLGVGLYIFYTSIIFYTKNPVI